MKLDRLNRGEAVAMVSAVALFVFMFLDWYGVEVSNGGSLSSTSTRSGATPGRRWGWYRHSWR